jgi:KDO2-lipid IV(A) lauroyltransferase
MQFLVLLSLTLFFGLFPFFPFAFFIGCQMAFISSIILSAIGKKVVKQALALHLSDKERVVIEKKSYRHLCDMFMEMIKTMSISSKK